MTKVLFSALAWLIAILLTGLLGGVLVHAPQWMLVLLAVFFSLTVVAYLAAYLVYLITIPDALRSVEAQLKQRTKEEGGVK